jgi:hypothetical protein
VEGDVYVVFFSYVQACGMGFWIKVLGVLGQARDGWRVYGTVYPRRSCFLLLYC